MSGRTCGFTLIELAVVLALLGAVLLVAIPRLSIFEEAVLRSDARKVASLIRRLDDSAASGKSYYRMTFSIGGRSLEAQKSSDGMVFESPEGMPPRVVLSRATGIKGLALSGGNKAGGTASILFGPSGAEPFSIELEASGFSCTVSYNPYSGKIRIT
ncbi:MAG: prepilin-type N-terminal cleavage/methylation domain-containing protein [Deltaproteobacteria bacterium]|nr:prepilin-type N-terminal cleavage/methylation domain-containing protein [Deltaproteobacteria bacterium]